MPVWWLCIASWSALSFVATAVGVETGIDLLESLQLHNSSHQGVSLAPGPQRLKPAFYLQGDYRDLKLPITVYQRAVELIRHNSEFTVAASLKQEEANTGTIVSFSHGFNRYLEVESSGRKDEIRLHYISKHDSLVHVETFPYRLADNTWHKVAVSVSGTQVELLVDCHTLYRRLIRPPDRNFTIPQLSLWVGQRNNKHSLFKGAIQDVRLVTGPHGYLSQCPHLNSSCPTCGQFSLLQNTVEQLTKNLLELSERLVLAEGRISRVEDCDCQKSCRLNGTVHPDGTRWQKGCEICACIHGEAQCHSVQCPVTNCKNPVFNNGECCPSCLKQCLLHGVMYDHGESMNLRQCVECECRDGSMKCNRIDPETMCPMLVCPTSLQFSVPGECCKFCPDVDECKQEGGLDGHHCHSHTKCVNTIGSYVCDCLPGYRRLDKFNCVELDECSSGKHACHHHANCINTQGSYHCQCRPGYAGDGYTCHPVCNQTCLNGGECLTPGFCSCRKGYIGPSCELDLDECTSDLHRCHDTSVCVNMPGWYYCRCKAGYRSIMHGTTLGTVCQDVDECSEKTHSCHSSATCVNYEGGFRCSCTHEEGQTCKLSCMFEGNEVVDGVSVSPAGQPCKRCKCTQGVMTCKDPACDCAARTGHTDNCCPQCDPSAACRHQELKHVVFRSSDRWIYQCQTCECLYGEVDCWPMECPPLSCPDPVLTPGDCCPRCDDDPCALDVSTNTSAVKVGQPCTYAGNLHESGTEWHDARDKCTACSCKDGRLCCSYDFGCDAASDKPNKQPTALALGAGPLSAQNASNHPDDDGDSDPNLDVDTKVPGQLLLYNRWAVTSEASPRPTNATVQSLQIKNKNDPLLFMDRSDNQTSNSNNSETLSVLGGTTKATQKNVAARNDRVVYVSDSSETVEESIRYENNATASNETIPVRKQHQAIIGEEETENFTSKEDIEPKT